jgi:hypothetical protein
MPTRLRNAAAVPLLVLAAVLVAGLLDLVGASAAGAAEGPTVTATAVTNITLTTATLNGTVNPNGVSTNCYFVYEPTSGLPSVTTPPTLVGSGTSPVAVSADAYGLLPNANYWVWLYATNADGVTVQSDNVTFTASAVSPTSPAIAPSVTADAATEVASTTATLHGTVNPNAVPTTYTFYYGLSAGDTPWDTGFASAGSGTSPVAVSADLTGLKPDTTYYVFLFAHDTTDTSLYSWGSSESFTALAATATATGPAAGPTATATGPAAGPTATATGPAAGPTAKTTAQARTAASRRSTEARIVIDSMTIVVARSRAATATVKLSCVGAACSGSVQLEKTAGKGRLLAGTSYRIVKGRTATVFLRLTPAGRAVLARTARKPARELLVATAGGGKTAEKSRRFVSLGSAHRSPGRSVAKRVSYTR